nr:MAG: hypothetical protein BECKSD772D_GA0070982_11714 [Candidatus Kentron sp. SD]
MMGVRVLPTNTHETYRIKKKKESNRIKIPLFIIHSVSLILKSNVCSFSDFYKSLINCFSLRIKNLRQRIKNASRYYLK